MKFSSFATATMVAAACVALSADAFAQRNRRGDAPSVVAFDFQRVVNESVAGRDLAAKLQQIQTQVSTEAQALAPEEQSLAQEGQRLTRLRGNRTDEQIRNEPALLPQFQQFEQRRQQLQMRAATLRGDLECSQRVALRDFRAVVTPVAQTVMASRGATAIVDSGTTFFIAPENDITTTVIEQLNQNPATRVANVARHSAAECFAPQQPAPAAQPQQ